MVHSIVYVHAKVKKPSRKLAHKSAMPGILPRRAEISARGFVPAFEKVMSLLVRLLPLPTSGILFRNLRGGTDA